MAPWTAFSCWMRLKSTNMVLVGVLLRRPRQVIALKMLLRLATLCPERRRSEVMVNGADDVFVERKGRLERVEGLVFEGEGQVFHLIERIVAPLGLRVDESMPYVDTRLSDDSRSQ